MAMDSSLKKPAAAHVATINRPDINRGYLSFIQARRSMLLMLSHRKVSDVNPSKKEMENGRQGRQEG